MKLTTFIQYCIPQHLASRLFGILLNSKNEWLKNRLIRKFIKHYNVNMDEVADSNLAAYPTFNAFFSRALKKGARPIVGLPEAIASPADGTIAQIGIADKNQLIQAKGHLFTLEDLFAGDKALADTFINGHYSTIYLGPPDYHRIHMPLTGTLKQMIYVPGKLFSVNENTVNDVGGIFARNERVICVFDTKAGPMAVIMVGAIFVGSMVVTWDGMVAPNRYNTITKKTYADKPIHLARGDEMGYFLTGSTVITLFAENKINWQSNLHNNSTIKMGQGIGTF
ncbi:MAG: archaetidylserine decarboxylase [Gammaproteobacteria bacterium]|jgi:phosphatidylserine decarboxylase